MEPLSQGRWENHAKERLTLLQRFCFGQPPLTFFKRELDLTKTQQRAAFRLFVVLMTISLLITILHPPTVISQAIVFAMLFHQSMTNTAISSRYAINFLGWLAMGVVLSIATAVLFQGEPWVLIPWTFMVLTTTMLHARWRRIPNFIGIIYVVCILYNPEHPDVGIDQALWMIPIIGVLTLTLSLIAQWILWPLSPLDCLVSKLITSLKTSRDHLTVIRQDDIGAQPTKMPPAMHFEPGRTAELLGLLEQASGSPSLPSALSSAWRELTLEVDALEAIMSELKRRYLTEPRDPTAPSDLAALAYLDRAIRAIATLLSTLGTDDRVPSTVSVEAPHYEAESPYQHALGRAIDATQRIFQLVDQLQGTPDHSLTLNDSPVQNTNASLFRLTWTIDRSNLTWAMKTTIAVMIALLFTKSLNVTSINTAIVTCMVVADSSLGSDYRRSLMRLIGAFMGGACGIIFITLLQPLMDTVAGYLLGIAPALFLASWVASAGPRLAAIGIQIGFAFALSVLDQVGPAQDLDVIWYRVLGIIVGIVIAGTIDALLWPDRSVTQARNRLVRVLENLHQAMGRDLVEQFNQTSSAYLLKVNDTLLSESKNLLDHALLEPGSQRPEQRMLIDEARSIGRSLTTLMKIIESRHRYFLDPDYSRIAHRLQEVMARLRLAYALEFKQCQRALDQGIRPLATPVGQEWDYVEAEIALLSTSDDLSMEDRQLLLASMDLEHKLVLQILESRRLIIQEIDRQRADPKMNEPTIRPAPEPG